MKNIHFFLVAFFGILNAAFQDTIVRIERILRVDIDLTNEYSAFGTTQDMLGEIQDLRTNGRATGQDISTIQARLDMATWTMNRYLGEAQQLVGQLRPTTTDERARAEDLSGLYDAHADAWRTLNEELRTMLEILRIANPEAAAAADAVPALPGGAHYPPRFTFNVWDPMVNGERLNFVGATVHYREYNPQTRTWWHADTITRIDTLEDLTRIIEDLYAQNQRLPRRHPPLSVIRSGLNRGGLVIKLQNRGTWRVFFQHGPRGIEALTFSHISVQV